MLPKINCFAGRTTDNRKSFIVCGTFSSRTGLVLPGRGVSMSLKAELGPQLPYLRRYTRALTGSQTLGDADVRDVLEALLASPEVFNQAASPRPERYRVFPNLWAGAVDLCHARGKVTNIAITKNQKNVE